MVTALDSWHELQKIYRKPPIEKNCGPVKHEPAQLGVFIR